MTSHYKRNRNINNAGIFTVIKTQGKLIGQFLWSTWSLLQAIRFKVRGKPINSTVVVHLEAMLQKAVPELWLGSKLTILLENFIVKMCIFSWLSRFKTLSNIICLYHSENSRHDYDTHSHCFEHHLHNFTIAFILKIFFLTEKLWWEKLGSRSGEMTA